MKARASRRRTSGQPVITSEYNMTHVKEWLEQHTPIDRLVSA